MFGRKFGADDVIQAGFYILENLKKRGNTKR
jgi:hypothetical protein